jgi:hypothetical protein
MMQLLLLMKIIKELFSFEEEAPELTDNEHLYSLRRIMKHTSPYDQVISRKRKWTPVAVQRGKGS